MAEDFSDGVDYLGSLKYVDRNNIGGIDICASGVFILEPASIDKRIKAVITSTMYDIPSFGNDADDSTWKSTITNLSEQRLKDVDNGYPSYSPSYWIDKEYNIGQIPPPPKENTDPNYNEWNTFYAIKEDIILVLLVALLNLVNFLWLILPLLIILIKFLQGQFYLLLEMLLIVNNLV